MAHDNPKAPQTWTANADLSTKQYRGMRVVSGARKCDVISAAAAAGQIFVGVLQNKPLQGEDATVCAAGLTKGVAGAAITHPAKLTFDNAGRFVEAAAGKDYFGVSVMGAAGAGTIITVDLDSKGTVPAA